jgi:hypothetical protein
MDDFRKLLMARGDHRVMIFQAAGPEARQKLLDQMIGEVANFEKRQGGDRYLFACWETNRKSKNPGFHYRLHVVP